MTTGFTLADWVGFGGAALTTMSFLPQAWLSFKTRDVSGISLGMYSVFTVGVALWLVYGTRQTTRPKTCEKPHAIFAA